MQGGQLQRRTFHLIVETGVVGGQATDTGLGFRQRLTDTGEIGDRSGPGLAQLDILGVQPRNGGARLLELGRKFRQTGLDGRTQGGRGRRRGGRRGRHARGRGRRHAAELRPERDDPNIGFGALDIAEALTDQLKPGRLHAIFRCEGQPRERLDHALLEPAAALGDHDAEVVLGGAKAGLGGLTVEVGCIAVAALDPPALLVHQREVVESAWIPLRGGQPVPAHRLGLIASNAAAGLVGEAEVELGIGNPAVGGLTEPEGRFKEVLAHPDPVGVHVADVELGRAETLLGRAEVQRERRREVGRPAAPQLAHHAQIEARRGEAPLGRLLVETDRGGVVLRHTDAVGVGIAERVQGLRLTSLRPGPNRLDIDLGGCRSRTNAQPQQGRRPKRAVPAR